MNKPLKIEDYRNICREFGVNPDKEYFDTMLVGQALWEAFVKGQESNQPNTVNKKEVPI